MSEENQERRQNVTREVCELKHKTLDTFCEDTKVSIRGLHNKMNGTAVILIAALIAALVDIAVR